MATVGYMWYGIVRKRDVGLQVSPRAKTYTKHETMTVRTYGSGGSSSSCPPPPYGARKSALPSRADKKSPALIIGGGYAWNAEGVYS